MLTNDERWDNKKNQPAPSANGGNPTGAGKRHVRSIL